MSKNELISEQLRIKDSTAAKWKVRKLSDDELEAIAGGRYTPPALE